MPWLAAAIGVALCAPSLGLGLVVDDHFLRLALHRPPPLPDWSRGWIDLFAFFDGRPGLVRRAMDLGSAPWWADQRLRIAFFRPLAGLTHLADFRLWPAHAWAMHAQSLLWFGAALAAAALAYRRLLGPPWVAGLAALLFAVDDAHSMPACWLANRNATIAALFGLLSIAAHDRWRRGRWRPGGLLSPAALLAGLLSGEGALGAVGYLAAYAVFLDPGRPWQRVRSLVPAFTAVVAWAATYRALGFGVSHSAMYIDPGANPVLFAQAVIERAPLLFFGQWVLPAGLAAALSQEAAHALWLGACAVVVIVGALLAPLLRRDPVARFFAAGMALAIVPGCGTVADDRVLFLAGFGAMGLVAQLLAGLSERAAWWPTARAWLIPVRAAAVLLVGLHLVLAPLMLAGAASRLRSFGNLFVRAAESLPDGPDARRQAVVIVNTPSAFLSADGPLIQDTRGRNVPDRMFVLSSGIRPVHVRRSGISTLVVKPEGGFLAAAGVRERAGEPAPPAFDLRYVLTVFDRLYRDTPMQAGERVALPDATVTVTSLTPDGRPAEAAFSFATPLESPGRVWLQWKDGRYAPFDLPAPGGDVTLPAVTVPF